MDPIFSSVDEREYGNELFLKEALMAAFQAQHIVPDDSPLATKIILGGSEDSLQFADACPPYPELNSSCYDISQVHELKTKRQYTYYLVDQDGNGVFSSPDYFYGTVKWLNNSLNSTITNSPFYGYYDLSGRSTDTILALDLLDAEVEASIAEVRQQATLNDLKAAAERAAIVIGKMRDFLQKEGFAGIDEAIARLESRLGWATSDTKKQEILPWEGLRARFLEAYPEGDGGYSRGYLSFNGGMTLTGNAGGALGFEGDFPYGIGARTYLGAFRGTGNYNEDHRVGPGLYQNDSYYLSHLVPTGLYWETPPLTVYPFYDRDTIWGVNAYAGTGAAVKEVVTNNSLGPFGGESISGRRIDTISLEHFWEAGAELCSHGEYGTSACLDVSLLNFTQLDGVPDDRSLKVAFKLGSQ